MTIVWHLATIARDHTGPIVLTISAVVWAWCGPRGRKNAPEIVEPTPDA